MEHAQLAIGDRIYYTGDMANIEDYGTVTQIRPANKWGPMTYDFELDDGRVMRGIQPAAFHHSPGRRFYRLAEWQEYRQQRIEAMQRDMERMHATKA